jgi:type II secretory pathway component GspD/PulD (secretin)
MPRSLRLALLAALLAAPAALPVRPLGAQEQPPPVRATPDGFLVDFQEQDLRVVLSALAEAGGLNVTFSNLPNRRTTLRLGQPVARDEILEVMRGLAESNGLVMTQAGSVIRIESAAAAAQQQRAQALQQPQRLQLFTYRLKHASASQVAPVIMALFTGLPQVRGNVGVQLPPSPTSFQVVPQPPRGVVPVTPGNVQQRPPGAAAEAAVEAPAAVPGSFSMSTIAGPGGERVTLSAGPEGISVDGDLESLPPQARARMEQLMSQANIARNAMLQQMQGGLALSSNANDIRIVAEENTNSLLVRATAQDWQLVQQLLQTIDLRPLQVLIEVTIAEVRRSNDLNVGVSGVATRTTPDKTVQQATAKLPSAASARDFVLTLTGGRGTIDFDVAINALQTRGELRVLSLPIIIAQNNKQAVLNVGTRRPFVQVSQSVTNDPLGRIETIQYLDVGTTLTITPTINADGYVNLQVQQTANSATNEVQFDAPVLSTREATTQVFVRDGQTTVIGGLADNTRDRSRSGIPLLSRIPLLGALFGNTTQNDVTSELFLFLTPHVVSGDEDLDRLRDAVREGSVLLKQVPTDPMIPPGATTDTIPLPPRPAPAGRPPLRQRAPVPDSGRAAAPPPPASADPGVGVPTALVISQERRRRLHPTVIAQERRGRLHPTVIPQERAERASVGIVFTIAMPPSSPGRDPEIAAGTPIPTLAPAPPALLRDDGEGAALRAAPAG